LEFHNLLLDLVCDVDVASLVTVVDLLDQGLIGFLEELAKDEAGRKAGEDDYPADPRGK